MTRPPRRLVLTWAILVVLLAGNVALAVVLPTAVTLLVNLAVAATMALMVLAVFMELAKGVSLFWVFAGAGFFWLAILFCLTATDYLTRYSFAPT